MRFSKLSLLFSLVNRVDIQKYVRYIKVRKLGGYMSSYIKGTYSKSIYESDKGYYIGIFKVSETNDEALKEYVGRSITITGYFHELNTMDTYMFYGKLVEHEKYGEQFQVDSYERCKPEDKDSIVEFLSSGLFKGIGEKKAKAIVDVLGDDTLKIILDNPSNLVLIPGISQANIDTLTSKLKEYEMSYDTIISLTEMGFSTKDAMLLYNYYKKETMTIISNNIYQIVEDIPEMYFKKVDMIAVRMGIDKKSIIRIKAALLYIMREISNTYGHSYYYREELGTYLPRVVMVEVEEELFQSCLDDLEKNLQIIVKEDKYYLKEMYEAECLIVKRFRMLNRNASKDGKKLDTVIDKIQDLFQITYNKEQLAAIKKSYLNDFLIITGGPGTGKTTILKGIIELYKEMNHYSYEELQSKIALLSPTGRAAKRMSEATFFPASTIHRFLKWQKESNTFQVNEYNKSKVELVVLDEVSMVDTYLMASLLRGISANCKVILLGDDHQLPSVGPGQVLHDLIESKCLETIELTKLYRQGKDSNIITLAYDIRRQAVARDIFNVGDDLTFIECSEKDVLNTICEVCDTYHDYSFRNIQVLVPMYKGINGIDSINMRLQDIFNPKDSLKKEYKVGDNMLREGDKVIQLTNMPDENVYNGDIGLIDRIVSSSKKEIQIDFDGNLVRYTPANFINFRQAFAISIHKAQGSEFDVVVVPVVKSYRKMLYQKLIYTAVTRAKKKLYLIGDFEALQMASQNIQEDTRRTTIKDYLVNGIK